jgi:hypothetical protein
MDELTSNHIHFEPFEEFYIRWKEVKELIQGKKNIIKNKEQ